MGLSEGGLGEGESGAAESFVAWVLLGGVQG